MTLSFPSSDYDFIKECVTSQGEDFENKENAIRDSEGSGALFNPGNNWWPDAVHYLPIFLILELQYLTFLNFKT